MTRLHFFVAVLSACLLGACTDGDAPSQAEEIALNASTEKVRPTPDAASRGQSAVVVRLRSDGLNFEEQGPGPRSVVALDFGEDEQAAMEKLSTVFGKSQTGEDEDCGAGPISHADFEVLLANFSDGRFAGYVAKLAQGVEFAGRGNLDLASARFEQLQSRANAERIESTLDGEIVFAGSDGGRIGGFLDGRGDGAPLRAVFAGITCFYR